MISDDTWHFELKPKNVAFFLFPWLFHWESSLRSCKLGPKKTFAECETVVNKKTWSSWQKNIYAMRPWCVQKTTAMISAKLVKLTIVTKKNTIVDCLIESQFDAFSNKTQICSAEICSRPH